MGRDTLVAMPVESARIIDNLRVVSFKPEVTYQRAHRPRIRKRPRSGTDRGGRELGDGPEPDGRSLLAGPSLPASYRFRTLVVFQRLQPPRLVRAAAAGTSSKTPASAKPGKPPWQQWPFVRRGWPKPTPR